GPVTQRQEEQPDRHGETDDRGGGGQPASERREQDGESGDNVVGGVNGDAGKNGHGAQPSSGQEVTMTAGGGRGQPATAQGSVAAGPQAGAPVVRKRRPPEPPRALGGGAVRPRPGRAGAGTPPARTSRAARPPGRSAGPRATPRPTQRRRPRTRP